VAEQARLRLYDALERLPEEQREAFVLRVIEQVSLREAAEILAVPDSTVSYRAQRAETQLRKWLDGGSE
jgi:RNA polymerase sigma-70 factor (ECF subfamily)